MHRVQRQKTILIADPYNMLTIFTKQNSVVDVLMYQIQSLKRLEIFYLHLPNQQGLSIMSL